MSNKVFWLLAVLIFLSLVSASSKKKVVKEEEEDEEEEEEDNSEDEDKNKVQIIKSKGQDIYELRMQRNQLNMQFQTSQQASRTSLCDKSHQQFLHNTTWSTAACVLSDLSFTIEATIGNTKSKNFEFINLIVDINQPWSWVKGKTCKSCDQMSSYSPITLGAASCSRSCKFSKYNAIQKYDPFTLKVNKDQEVKLATITGFESGLQGQFFYDQLSFLAYNPNKNITLRGIIAEKIAPKTFNALEDFFTIKTLKFLQAQKMVNYDNFMGDGAIGLAKADYEYDNANLEGDTSFLKQLIEEEKSKLEEGDNIFGVYLNSITHEYALTLGGYNAEYSQDVNIQDYWVGLKQNNKNSNYQYVLGVKAFRSSGTTIASSTKTEAILSLNTSFLQIPWEIIQKLIADWNKRLGMDCLIVDNRYQTVYCRRVIPRELDNEVLEFEFLGGEQYKIKFDRILRQCYHDKKSLFGQDISRSVANECIISISVSQDPKRFILGEVFLDQHYIIFDISNNRIGFLPPPDKSFFEDEYDKRVLVELLVKIVTAVFILGVIVVFCYNRILVCLKGFLNILSFISDWEIFRPKRNRRIVNKFQTLSQTSQFQQLPEREIGIQSNNNNAPEKKKIFQTNPPFPQIQDKYQELSQKPPVQQIQEFI